MARRYKKLDELPPGPRRELEARPEFRSRFLLFNILPLAFVMMSFVFLVIILLDVIPRPDTPPSSPVWPALVLVSVVEVGMIAFLGKRFLKPVLGARTLQQAAARGLTPLVLVAAFAVSVCIYAMLGPSMAMPHPIQLALWVAGFGLLLGSMAWVRGKVRAAMLLALANQDE